MVATAVGTMKRILYVDDDIDDQMLVEMALHDKGVKVEECLDPAKLDNRNLDGYDLILVDQRLPGTSGAEVVKKIRQQKQAEGVPIYITSDFDYDQIKEFLERENISVNGFIRKLGMMKELRKILDDD